MPCGGITALFLAFTLRCESCHVVALMATLGSTQVEGALRLLVHVTSLRATPGLSPLFLCTMFFMVARLFGVSETKGGAYLTQSRSLRDARAGGSESRLIGVLRGGIAAFFRSCIFKCFGMTDVPSLVFSPVFCSACQGIVSQARTVTEIISELIG